MIIFAIFSFQLIVYFYVSQFLMFCKPCCFNLAIQLFCLVHIHKLLLMNPLPFLSSLRSHSATNTRNSPDHTWARNPPTSASVTSPRNSSPLDRPSSDCKPAPTRVPPRPARTWAPVVKSSSESNFPDGRTDGLDVLISFTNGAAQLCIYMGFVWGKIWLIYCFTERRK